ncbi:N-terminal half of MaoC dehydratase [Parafrankia irregularis]|uniref:N-terminal half of MaoC dehydratase n=1 Tax=Parafrankia irregularis TaxID=795642 RepID=A0A0S4QJY2_9ACTN|nr:MULTISPECIES: MaoC family dehydratase N-terminal domain-containing protein [Parafrankia]MBE3200802.1 MaoC family dehydratase N-terminal domain-containing protein [Parafrankia sp. CH37]CUU54806.1 N-terminal half of MaoC dehydratase [Parafrankia irregularis]
MSTTDVTGRALRSATVVVERGQVAAFATAVTDTSPVYQRPDVAAEAGFAGIPAPPTFTFAARLLAAYEELSPEQPPGAVDLTELIGELRAGGGLILHAEQEFTYHAPVLVGAVLTLTGVVEDVQVKTGRDDRRRTFVRVRSEFRDEAGALVVTEVMTLLHRS